MRLPLACSAATALVLALLASPRAGEAAGSWRLVAPSPLSPRADHSVVWTGREMIVWGGDAGGSYFADGAAYDPRRDTWRKIAPAAAAG